MGGEHAMRGTPTGREWGKEDGTLVGGPAAGGD